ncbi:MAG: hypothetical protein H6Q96_861, partial [Nitrospirae bacterium]|nr:hypothetical protein [Nitrospirota bacterium]
MLGTDLLESHGLDGERISRVEYLAAETDAADLA